MNKELLITMLIEKGWFNHENFFEQSFCLDLLNEAKEIKWSQAQVGKDSNKQEALAIRNDSISWIKEI